MITPSIYINPPLIPQTTKAYILNLLNSLQNGSEAIQKLEFYLWWQAVLTVEKKIKQPSKQTNRVDIRAQFDMECGSLRSGGANSAADEAGADEYNES